MCFYNSKRLAKIYFALKEYFSQFLVIIVLRIKPYFCLCWSLMTFSNENNYGSLLRLLIGFFLWNLYSTSSLLYIFN